MKYTERPAMHGLHLGVVLPTFGPSVTASAVRDAVVAAETAGYDSCWVTDHVAVDERISDVYGTTSEALITAAHILGLSERIAVGVSALIVPQRPRLLTLKQVASLSMLSEGRLRLAVAAGWLDSEFAAMDAGSIYAMRGDRLDDWLAWSSRLAGRLGGPVEEGSKGRLVWMGPDFFDGRLPPIWVAGRARRARGRAAALGVWHPSAISLDDFGRFASEFYAARPDGTIVMRLSVDFARSPVRASVDERGHVSVVGPVEWVAERLAAYLAAGATGFTIALANMRPGVADRIWRFARDVAPLLRADLRRARDGLM